MIAFEGSGLRKVMTEFERAGLRKISQVGREAREEQWNRM